MPALRELHAFLKLQLVLATLKENNKRIAGIDSQARSFCATFLKSVPKVRMGEQMGSWGRVGGWCRKLSGMPCECVSALVSWAFHAEPLEATALLLAA